MVPNHISSLCGVPDDIVAIVGIPKRIESRLKKYSLKTPVDKNSFLLQKKLYPHCTWTRSRDCLHPRYVGGSRQRVLPDFDHHALKIAVKIKSYILNTYMQKFKKNVTIKIYNEFLSLTTSDTFIYMSNS